MKRTVHIVCVSAVVAALAWADPAGAASYSVPAGGSLRQAVILANNSPGDDVIQIAAGTFTFSIAGKDEDFAATGDLDIRGNLSIVGAGSADTIIDAGGLDRVFQVFTGVRFDITGVKIMGGETGALFADGGGILTSGVVSMTDATVCENSAHVGGGIYNDGGTLTMDESTVRDNSATSTLFSGGGIVNLNSGTMQISDSTVSGNSSPGSGAGIFNSNTSELIVDNSTISGNVASMDHSNTRGGGIYNNSTSTVELVNTTISGNRSGYYAGGVYQGGGTGSTTITMTNCTITDNWAKYGGGILNDDDDSTVSIKNTIVADNTAAVNSPDWAASITSLGYNLIGDISGGTGAVLPSDIWGGDGSPVLDPILGPLSDNGGPTLTHALLPNSPAIDAIGAQQGYPPTDQRGFPRPYNGFADIGAFEVPEPAMLSLLTLGGLALVWRRKRGLSKGNSY